MISKTVQPLARYVGDVTHAADYAYAPPDRGMLHLLHVGEWHKADIPRCTQQAQSNLPVCPLIATGGTIAMKIDPVKHAPVPAISGEDLLATVPEVADHARVEVKNVSNVPSDYMDPPRWIALTKEVTAALARPDVSGVIISHGTDTLEETCLLYTSDAADE